MANDTQPHDSRRKHRRASSSDDEAEKEKSSKRHRHRHHRHHRRHRHRHGSKKREEESDREGQDTNLSLVPYGSPHSSPAAPAAPLSGSRPDDEVEEGEILEEEGGFVGGKDRVESDFGRNGSENRILGDHLEGEKSHPINGEQIDLKSDMKEENINANSRLKIEDSKGLGEHSSPSRGQNKQNADYRVDVTETDKDLSWKGKEDPSCSTVYKSRHKAHSSSHDRYHNDSYYRHRSRSRDSVTERSRSQSVMDEEHSSKRRRHYERDYYSNFEKGKSEHELDEDVIGSGSKDRRNESRDRNIVERERSVSQSRYMSGDDRHGSWDSRDRDRDRDRDRSKERDTRNERRREKEREMIRDMDADRDRRRDKKRERSMDRDLGKERRRDNERERTVDRDVERERRREKERHRSRDREWRRDREVGVNGRDKERDRDRDRDRASERDRHVGRERNRDMERGRDMQRERDIERERDTVRRRDKAREIEGHEVEFEDKYRNSRLPRREDKIKRSDQKDHNNSLGGKEDGSKRYDDDEEDDLEGRMLLILSEQEDEDLNRIEESRRRRQAILEKYRSQQSQQENETHSEGADKGKTTEQTNPSLSGKDNAPEASADRNNGAELVVTDHTFSLGKSPQQNGNGALEKSPGAGGLGEGTPKSERSEDMFCDDIFGDSPAGVRKSAKGDGLHVERSGLHDNWDDAEGYYSHRLGEVLDGRYEIIAVHGKGVFSTVVRARDLKAGKGEPEEVAVKIIRSNETMYKAGTEELVILRKLVGADPDNKRHCVRFLSSFKYRNHLCLVFESLHMNLREVLKKFGRNIGLKLTAVRAYAKQLFIALKHLKNCGVLHCDIKPDNMLVTEAKNVLKLCDFGNAMFAGKNEITPYLVSRFYRAPEIILGLPYDHPMDMWSVGCCLYELYTGKVLFPGPTNNDMLRLHMELKGPFPKKMLRKGAFTDMHFDQDLNFHATEEDPVTKKTIKRMVVNIKPKDIGSLVKGSPGEDPKMLANLKDLLEKIFILDPDKRMTVSQALAHPFITGK